MTERQKIMKLIENYKAIFEMTDMDVAESMKGQWFFSRYNKKNKYFDALYHFETAEELAEMMLGELATDIFITIDSEPEPTPEFENFAEISEMKESYQPYIERLLEYLGK